MILTVTINPSVDRNIEVDRLVFEDRAYILSRRDSAGGRGMNASRVLDSFGAKTLAIVTSGGVNGARLEKLAAKSGFPVKAVPIDNETRVNLTITDKQGLAIRLNERGPKIAPEELTRVEKAVAHRLESASWLMLCGSVPPGVSTDFYTKLIRMARERKVKNLLDTDGDALLHGIEACPTIVSPNQPEAERLLNRALITRAQFLEAATRIKAMGAEAVMLSSGRARGGGGERESIAGSDSTADRCRIAIGRGRCSGGSLCMGCDEEERLRRLRALGGGGGNGDGHAAGTRIREPGADEGSV